MDEDYNDEYIDEGNYSEDEDYEYEKDESEESDEEGQEIEDDDISEVYQPKIEKKTDSILKSKSRNIILVPEEERITDNRLHKNEAAFIIATRAKEIAKHATNFVENNTSNNAISIAYNELYTHRCPIKLRRHVGISNKGDIIVEEWDTKTMVLPNIPPL